MKKIKILRNVSRILNIPNENILKTIERLKKEKLKMENEIERLEKL